MAKSGKFKEKTILLLDENQKTNDHYLLCWNRKKGDWEPSISKKWDSALFANADLRNLDLQPYQYNMVQGLDFTIKF
jgi:lycopene beta-cyclase